MSIPKIDLASLPRQVNFQEDLREKRAYIFLGTFTYQPAYEDCQQETIRELVVKANFESQDALYALGNICIYTKKPLASYDWQVIHTTIKTFYSNLGNSKTSFFLIAAIPAAILLGFPLWMPAAFISLAALLFFREAFKQVQKMNRDQVVAFQKLTVLPPINSHVLISNLQVMLSSSYRGDDYPLGQIPHPTEERPLTLGEKEKFLNEASAFFAIKKSDLTDCWKMGITEEEVTACIQRIPNWEALASFQQEAALNHLALGTLYIKQQQKFLSLLTESARSCFDENFRSREIPVVYPIQIPLPSITSQQTLAAQAI